MSNIKTLSIIIPTYNRNKVLLHTLSVFKEQVLRNSNDVELIVCDNASTDNTLTEIGNYHNNNKWFNIVSYHEHVSGGQSIYRAIENVSGKYFWLWGDDDVPAPMAIDYILSLLDKYNNIGGICFNYLRGYSCCTESNFEINNIFISLNVFRSNEILYENTTDFISNYACLMSFMSINVISKKAWDINGKKYFSSQYYGYEFLYPILHSLSEQVCLFVDYPLCIQRHGYSSGDGGEMWPLYALVGLPRVLNTLEKDGLIYDWYKAYKDWSESSDDNYYAQILSASYFPGVYIPFIDEICKYQRDHKRVRWLKLLFSRNKRLVKIARLILKSRKSHKCFFLYMLKSFFMHLRKHI